MYCKQCGGFGFYSVIDQDGKRDGKICKHGTQIKILRQDLDTISPNIRMHSESQLPTA